FLSFQSVSPLTVPQVAPAPATKISGPEHFAEEGRMGMLRSCGAVAVLLAAVGGARAQSVTLAENTRVNDSVRLQLSMRLTGEMVVLRDGKPATLKLAATAEHRYHERVLAQSQ